MKRAYWAGVFLVVACSACSADGMSVPSAMGAVSDTAPVESVRSVAGAAGKASVTPPIAGAIGGVSAGATGAAAGGGGIAAEAAAGGGAAVKGSGAIVAGGGGIAAGGGGGPAVAGSSGAVADGGSGSIAPTAMPSAGCAKRAARPANGVVMQADRIYTFPESYDGTKPAPLLLALHAAGNPNTQLQKLTQGSRLETELVRAFPKSAGNAWVYNTDVTQVNDVLDEMISEYCIDERRVFATGHSSGAQMVVQMLCKGEQRFRAVAPVAASKYCAELAPIPVLYIQGQMDAQRGGGNGEDVVRVFRSGNACAETSMPVASVSSCTSSFDRKEVAPGCVSYEGCEAPTLWCSHNDNGYNNSDGRQHGWPCFASEAIADFFLGF